MIQSDNNTDSIVYTSKKFQPYSESFSDHYAFVGPSVFSNVLPEKKKEKPLIEIGAGTMLRDDSCKGIRIAIQEILGNNTFGNAAAEYSADFRACPGIAGAAEFIENAPHSSDGFDIIGELNKATVKFQFLYWLIIITVINLIGFLMSWKYVWMIGIAAGILSSPIGRLIQKRKYANWLRNVTYSSSQS